MCWRRISATLRGGMPISAPVDTWSFGTKLPLGGAIKELVSSSMLDRSPCVLVKKGFLASLAALREIIFIKRDRKRNGEANRRRRVPRAYEPGPGLLESAYETVLALELENRGLQVADNRPSRSSITERVLRRDPGGPDRGGPGDCGDQVGGGHCARSQKAASNTSFDWRASAWDCSSTSMCAHQGRHHADRQWDAGLISRKAAKPAKKTETLRENRIYLVGLRRSLVRILEKCSENGNLNCSVPTIVLILKFLETTQIVGQYLAIAGHKAIVVRRFPNRIDTSFSMPLSHRP